MSKYERLWKYVAMENKSKIVLSFDEIAKIIGISIDHSFLNYKKELSQFGFSVGKISLKNKTVEFIKLP